MTHFKTRVDQCDWFPLALLSRGKGAAGLLERRMVIGSQAMHRQAASRMDFVARQKCRAGATRRMKR